MKKFGFLALLGFLCFSAVAQAGDFKGVIFGPGAGITAVPVLIAQGGCAATTAFGCQDNILAATGTNLNPQTFSRVYTNGGVTYQSQQKYTFQDGPATLPHWRACAAKVRNGTGNCLFLMMGDSTIFGAWGNGTSSGNQDSFSLPTHLARILNSSLPALSQGFFGDGFGSGGGTNRFTANDSRIVKGSSWSDSACAHNVGFTCGIGGALLTASTNTNALSFTPKDYAGAAVSTDTVRVYYVSTVSSGVLAADIDGGAATTQATVNADNLVRYFEVSGSLAAHTYNVKWSSGGAVFVTGILAYNSAQKSVWVVNAGWPGANTDDFYNTTGNTHPYGPYNAIANVAPDVCVFNNGINDWNNSVLTYQADLQALVTKCLLTSDVILMASVPSDPSVDASLAVQKSYVDKMYQIAVTSSTPVIDVWSYWGSYAAKNALGLYGNDKHPNGAGYADEARLMADVLLK